MNTQKAYIEGFVKRAAEYGFSEGESMDLLKQANRLREAILSGEVSPETLVSNRNFISKKSPFDLDSDTLQTLDEAQKKLFSKSLGAKFIPPSELPLGSLNAHQEAFKNLMRSDVKPRINRIGLHSIANKLKRFLP